MMEMHKGSEDHEGKKDMTERIGTSSGQSEDEPQPDTRTSTQQVRFHEEAIKPDGSRKSHRIEKLHAGKKNEIDDQ